MDVIEVQEALAALGYKPGPIDGIWGSQSKSACKQFQAANGLTADGIPGPSTQAALQAATQGSEGLPARDPMPLVMQRAQRIGHQVWGDPWRLWLFGIRSRTRTAGTFDDTLGCCWTEGDGIWRSQVWRGTTDPGLKYLQNPMKRAGCAILVAGQYLDTWTIDLHSGKYKALCQRAGDVAVYRDANRDASLDLDPSTISRGRFGINLHASTRIQGNELEVVGPYSAGCQVHATEVGFTSMMDLAEKQVANTGRKTFSYTLLDSW